MNDRPDNWSWDGDLFRLLAENIKDYAIFLVDTERRVRSWTAGAERLLGYSEEEILGQTADVFFTSEDRQNNVPKFEIEQTLASGRGEDDRWHIRKGGSLFWSSGVMTPLWQDGQLRGFAKIMRDQTELKQSRDAEYASRRLTEAVVDTVQESLLVLDADLIVRNANRSFYELFQETPETTEGHRIFDLGNKQWDIPQLRTLLEKIVPQNTFLTNYEVEHEFPKIGRRFMRLNARRLRREGERDELLLLAIADETERLEAERERYEIETRFTSLVKNIQDHSIFTVDERGRITTWNLAAERILGYTESEALGLPFAKLFTPEDVEAGMPEWELNTARETGRAEDERWHVRKNGERFWALGIVTAMHDADGALLGFSKILRDMTSRKQEEQALLRRTGQLRELAAASSRINAANSLDSVLRVITGEARQIIGAHQAVSSLTENQQWAQTISTVSLSDKYAQWRDYESPPTGAGIYSLVCRTNSPMRLSQAQLEAHEAWRGFSDEAGKHPPMRGWLAVPIIGRDGENVGLIQLSDKDEGDFTQHDEAILAQLASIASVAIDNAKLYEALREADRRKNEFLAMLAHELRNPLAPIRSGIDLLTVNGADTQITDLMQHQVEHLVRLVDDLLDVSRMIKGRVELRTHPVLLSHVIDRAIDTASPLIAQNHHHLTVEIPEEPLVLDADPVRLGQVVSNLLANAAKYTQPGGQIWLTVQRQQQTVTISVRDTGVGMEPELLPYVFDLFRQSERSIDRSQGGLGIGLTVVKNLVELHGGSVAARSEGTGQGSEFIIQLPSKLSEPSAVDAVDDPPATTRERRVLVVDDNVGAAKMLALLLQKMSGHTVAVAHDGPKAVAIAKEVTPDLILLDLGLPGMSGYAVAEQLRAIPELADVFIVALTGYGTEEDRRQTTAAGFDEHLVKPPSIDSLRRLFLHPKLRR